MCGIVPMFQNHNYILNRAYMQQQTKLLPNAELAAHTWRLIEKYPHFDQENFDFIDSCIEQLPNDVTSTLVGIFWILGCINDSFVEGSPEKSFEWNKTCLFNDDTFYVE